MYIHIYMYIYIYISQKVIDRFQKFFHIFYQYTIRNKILKKKVEIFEN